MSATGAKRPSPPPLWLRNAHKAGCQKADHPDVGYGWEADIAWASVDAERWGQSDMKKRHHRLSGILALLAVGAATVWLFDGYWHYEAVRQALRSAGYGEFTWRQAVTSKCSAGQRTSAFIAQGGRVGRETKGYVCTGYFGPPQVREGALESVDRLDWH